MSTIHEIPLNQPMADILSAVEADSSRFARWRAQSVTASSAWPIPKGRPRERDCSRGFPPNSWMPSFRMFPPICPITPTERKAAKSIPPPCFMNS